MEQFMSFHGEDVWSHRHPTASNFSYVNALTFLGPLLVTFGGIWKLLTEKEALEENNNNVKKEPKNKKVRPVYFVFNCYAFGLPAVGLILTFVVTQLGKDMVTANEFWADQGFRGSAKTYFLAGIFLWKCMVCCDFVLTRNSSAIFLNAFELLFAGFGLYITHDFIWLMSLGHLMLHGGYYYFRAKESAGEPESPNKKPVLKGMIRLQAAICVLHAFSSLFTTRTFPLKWGVLELIYGLLVLEIHPSIFM